MRQPPCRDLVVVVASAGGIAALQRLISRLPPDFPAAVVVLVHLSAANKGALPRVLERAGNLPASLAEDGAVLKPGRIHVAPPDRHLLLSGGTEKGYTTTLSRAPRYNGHRPAADPLLFSAALAADGRAIGVVLSGMLDDGAAGGAALRRHGGLLFVQDPADALFDGMPTATLAVVPDARVAPATEIAELLDREVRAEFTGPPPLPDPELMGQIIRMLADQRGDFDPRRALPTKVSCPECGGPIYAVPTRPGRAAEAAPVERYECVVGHVWTGSTLLNGQAGQVEWALEMAARQLFERMTLTRRMATDAEKQGRSFSATGFDDASRQAEQALETIRRMLTEVGERPETAAEE